MENSNELLEKNGFDIEEHKKILDEAHELPVPDVGLQAGHPGCTGIWFPAYLSYQLLLYDLKQRSQVFCDP